MQGASWGHALGGFLAPVQVEACYPEEDMSSAVLGFVSKDLGTGAEGFCAQGSHPSARPGLTQNGPGSGER